jgi:lipid-A-disaccharide synthase-like uncharacterized protein
MLRTKRQWMIAAEVLLLLAVVGWVCYSLLATDHHKPDDAVSIKIPMRGTAEEVHLYRLEDGSYRFRVTTFTDKAVDFTPDAFAQRVYTDHKSRGLLAVVLNITSPWGMLWVGLGLLGQVLFTGRMVVQWLASEKKNRSVVPPSFWWMSLIGATMLMVYFLWRKDAVGVLGQSAGWFIYLRNLWLIYHKTPAMMADTPAEEAAAASASADASPADSSASSKVLES